MYLTDFSNSGIVLSLPLKWHLLLYTQKPVFVDNPRLELDPSRLCDLDLPSPRHEHTFVTISYNLYSRTFLRKCVNIHSSLVMIYIVNVLMVWFVLSLLRLVAKINFILLKIYVFYLLSRWWRFRLYKRKEFLNDQENRIWGESNIF